MTTLAIEGVSQTYGHGSEHAVEVLSAVSWTFPAGSSTALLGRSGSGKSTLLSILGLLLTPTAGTCRVDGTDVAKLPERSRAAIRNATIGFLFQRSHLAPALPLWKSVAMPATFSRGGRSWSRRDLAARAHELLELVGLGGLGNRLPNQLSLGQRQRAALARALLLDPPVVLADEPTGSLDEVTGDRVARILYQLCAERGTTLVVATHDLRLAELADCRIELTAGRIDRRTGLDAP